MCYELEWFRWKRATEAERKREQPKVVTERAPATPQPEPSKTAAQPDPAPEVQEQLEPV